MTDDRYTRMICMAKVIHVMRVKICVAEFVTLTAKNQSYVIDRGRQTES